MSLRRCSVPARSKLCAYASGALITVVKTGEHGRPFRLETLDGALIMERVLAPGTAVIMTLQANLKTKHGVPAVVEAGSSGSCGGFHDARDASTMPFVFDRCRSG